MGQGTISPVLTAVPVEGAQMESTFVEESLRILVNTKKLNIKSSFSENSIFFESHSRTSTVE